MTLEPPPPGGGEEEVASFVSLYCEVSIEMGLYFTFAAIPKSSETHYFTSSNQWLGSAGGDVGWEMRLTLRTAV